MLIIRILQGVVGGSSTLALIIISSPSRKETVSADIGLFQSCVTLGQMLGPLLGSIAAAALGYRGAFLSASTILLGSFTLC
jgi:MFS family permease